MPYKSEKIRIAGTQYDRRIKLTPDQKEYIKWLREKQLISYSKLAKIFGVSKRLIQFICCPDKYLKNKESFKLNGQYIIQNSQYEGNLGVELCASLDEFLSNVEHLYTRYKHSIPSTMSECKNRKYFKALSDKDLEDEDMLFGVGRDIAQVELELYILCQIILGIGWDANKMGKWFWQSNKDRDLVILKNWVTVEK